MCDRPILIDNPYYGLNKIGLNYLHDTVHTKLKVPCGNCPTCIALRQSYFVQRCQMECLDNDMYFFTLTYNNKMLPKRVVNGISIPYPDYIDVRNMFKRIRKYNLLGTPFRYFVVSEYGGKKHRPHFHGILFIPKNPSDKYYDKISKEIIYSKVILSQWCRNVGTNRKPIYEPLCTYVNSCKGRTFDFHYVDPLATNNAESDVGFYVSKYILKSSKYVDSLKSALKLNLSDDEFVEEWKYFKPKCYVSKGFGNIHSEKVKNHIRMGIDFSINHTELPYPIFINPISGQEFPLSPYYQKCFLTVDDSHTFFYRGKDDPDTENPKEVVQNSLEVDIRFTDVCNYLDSKLNSFNYLDYE